jgi:hypothetical protein
MSNTSFLSDLHQDAQASAFIDVMDQATKHAIDNNFKRCDAIKQGVIMGMI